MSLLSGIFEEQEAAGREPERQRAAVMGPLLAVDIGSVYTRALLFDIVDGQYRFVGRSQTPTTAQEPWNDVLVGLFDALLDISEATGRALVDRQNGTLVIPEEEDFVGVDTLVATASAGQPIRTVLIGLMPDFSLESGKRAAASTYLSLVDVFSLADRRTPEEQINALTRANADLVLVVGGTDGGSRQSMQRIFDMLLTAYSLMHPQMRPPVLYAGNRSLVSPLKEQAEEVGMQVLVADNVRPALEVERLDSAQRQLATLYSQQKMRSTPGFGEIVKWTDEGVFPTAHGFGRMVHVLSALFGHNVLGIDLGSKATTVAASNGRERFLNVFETLGIGHSARDTLDQIRPENLARWLTYELPDPEVISDYAWNKSLFPHVIPASLQDLEMEYAMAREIIRSAVLSARRSWRGDSFTSFPTVLLSGSTLANTPHYGWSVLIALDALLPAGITRLLLDPYGMAAALGAATPTNPQVVTQVLETGAFFDMGSVVSLSGRARRGDIVLRGSIRQADSSRPEPFEVPFGEIVRLPLEYGVPAEVTFQPRRVEIAGLKRKRITIAGGEMGLIIDARGRPWRMPREPEQRQKVLRDWQHAITQED